MFEKDRYSALPLETAIFVDHIRQWAENMEDMDLPHAYHRAMDARAVGESLVEAIDARPDLDLMKDYPGTTPRALLDGLGGFLLCLTALCEAAEAERRKRMGSKE